MTIMYPYYGEQEQPVAVEQLQLFDPTDYVDKEGFHNIEIDVPTWQFDFISNAAKEQDLTMNEWMNKVLKEYTERVING